MNNPLRYVDPSGHCVEEGDAPNGSDANQDICPTPEPTILEQAEEGDLLALLLLLLPTTYGWRIQGELSLDLGSWGISFSLGLNDVYNAVSNELESSIDFSVEVGGGIGAGGSVTTGPVVGFFSSTSEDVTRGNSNVAGGTLAGDAAISVSAQMPTEGDCATCLHVDPKYGITPVTYYGGLGIGGGYAGAGAGRSTNLISGDGSWLLPWNWIW